MHTLTPFPLARSIIKARELLDNWLCNQLASGSRLKQWEGARVSPFNLNLTTPPPHPTKDAFHSGHSSHHSCGQPSKVAATPNSETILLQQHAARVNRSSPITDQRSAITDHHVGGNSSSSPSNRRDQKKMCQKLKLKRMSIGNVELYADVRQHHRNSSKKSQNQKSVDTWALTWLGNSQKCIKFATI